MFDFHMHSEVSYDAHKADPVGQHIDQACGLVGEIFGHVCTFENRQPVFYKL